MKFRDSVKRHALGKFLPALCAVLVAGAASEGLALPIAHSSGLEAGDQYRLTFVTSTSRDGTSPHIQDYNDFVTAAAHAVPELLALGTTWTAIASTGAASARGNTNTDPYVEVGFPIYLLNGSLVAHHNADLWDGSIGTPLSIDENGNLSDPATVWAGTLIDGDTARHVALGALFAFYGSNHEAGEGWIRQSALGHTAGPGRFYAVSGVLTVVPEPKSAVLVSLGLLGLGTWRRCQ